MKKVKFENQKLEHVYIANWKVLQEAFKKLHIEKVGSSDPFFYNPVHSKPYSYREPFKTRSSLN